MFILFWGVLILVVIVGTVVGMAFDNAGGTRNPSDRLDELVKKALMFSEIGNFNEALKCLDEATDVDRGNVYACYALGVISLRKGDINQCREVLKYLRTANNTFANDLYDKMQSGG